MKGRFFNDYYKKMGISHRICSSIQHENDPWYRPGDEDKIVSIIIVPEERFAIGL
jgi:hypothetical protein